MDKKMDKGNGQENGKENGKENVRGMEFRMCPKKIKKNYKKHLKN